MALVEEAVTDQQLDLDVDLELTMHVPEPVHIVCCVDMTTTAFCGAECEPEEEELQEGPNCWECVRIDLAHGGGCPYGHTCPVFIVDESL